MKKFKRIKAFVYFNPPSISGFEMPLFNGYRTVMELEGHFWSIILETTNNEKIILTGQSSYVYIAIPFWEGVHKFLEIGKTVQIAVGTKVIGDGVITDIDV